MPKFAEDVDLARLHGTGAKYGIPFVGEKGVTLFALPGGPDRQSNIPSVWEVPTNRGYYQPLGMSGWTWKGYEHPPRIPGGLGKCGCKQGLSGIPGGLGCSGSDCGCGCS